MIRGKATLGDEETRRWAVVTTLTIQPRLQIIILQFYQCEVEPNPLFGTICMLILWRVYYPFISICNIYIYVYIFPDYDYGMTIVLPVAGDKLDKHVDQTNLLCGMMDQIDPIWGECCRLFGYLARMPALPPIHLPYAGSMFGGGPQGSTPHSRPWGVRSALRALLYTNVSQLHNTNS